MCYVILCLCISHVYFRIYKYVKLLTYYEYVICPMTIHIDELIYLILRCINHLRKKWPSHSTPPSTSCSLACPTRTRMSVTNGFRRVAVLSTLWPPIL
ncbi:hypothetical protein PBCV1_a671L [Paramecium bursaria Chlorella virus 1]|uniref:Uncharacterized protein n=1 Tax=Paramecium bursaria Chlorella virus 1 TaxID=10506 RepID=O41153_PBCV1|nr:hypothetical protein PBCV1_a671L [Paramecium bursaria Chlorella virus 1]AAC97048.1 hypothetical protein [Paramecium bursaria Chlorella virus 1]